MAKKKSSKGGSDRELIDTGTDKRYVRRNAEGQFTESDDVGRSLSKDVQQHSKKLQRRGKAIKVITQLNN